MIKDARHAVVAALRPVGIAVHAYPPPAATPPYLVLTPGTPYRVLTTLRGNAVDVRLDVLLVVAAGNPESLDDYLDATVAALTAAGLRPDPAIAPPVVASGVLSATVPTLIAWQE